MLHAVQHLVEATRAPPTYFVAYQRRRTEAVATSIQGLPNNAWISYDVTSYIQNDLTNGYSYAAFSFDPDTSGGGWRNSSLSFASAESANKPFLQINAVPEPSSALLMGFGCLSLAFRRSRH